MSPVYYHTRGTRRNSEKWPCIFEFSAKCTVGNYRARTTTVTNSATYLLGKIQLVLVPFLTGRVLGALVNHLEEKTQVTSPACTVRG